MDTIQFPHFSHLAILALPGDDTITAGSVDRMCEAGNPVVLSSKDVDLIADQCGNCVERVS